MRNLFTTTHIEKSTLTIALSLMARGMVERGRTSFFPVMLRLSKHLIILCTILVFSACNKLPQTLTEPTTTVAFSGSSPGSNSVYMARNSSLSSGDVLAIDVKTKNISSNVYGAAFDVDFDSSEMTWDNYAEGSFLETGGNTVNYQVGLQSNNSNKLVVGIARQAGATGISGSGTLVTLKFKVTGNLTVDLSNYALKDSSNQAISGITWYGGTVTVQ